MYFTFFNHHRSKTQYWKVLKHIKNGMKCWCHSLMLIYIILILESSRTMRLLISPCLLLMTTPNMVGTYSNVFKHIQTDWMQSNQIETVFQLNNNWDRLDARGGKGQTFPLNFIYLKTTFLNIGQSHVKQASIHIIQKLNLTKCFTSVIIVIMRAIECIILGDMWRINMNLTI